MAADQLRLNVVALNEFITCPLCLGYFRDAHTLAECMHTFCKVCILKYWGDDEGAGGGLLCPVCNVRAGHHALPAIRQDRALQGLVELLFPDYAEQDRLAAVEFYHSRGLEQVPASASVTPVAPTPGVPGSAMSSVSPHPVGKAPSAKRMMRGGAYADEVTFKIVSETPLLTLANPFVRVSGRATVCQLRRLLARDCSSSSDATVDPSELELYCGGEVLSGENSLRWVVEEKLRLIDPEAQQQITLPVFVVRCPSRSGGKPSSTE